MTEMGLATDDHFAHNTFPHPWPMPWKRLVNVLSSDVSGISPSLFRQEYHA